MPENLKAATCSAPEAICDWTCAYTVRTAKGHCITASAADGKSPGCSFSPPSFDPMCGPIRRGMWERSSERTRVAINTVRARLTVLGFNLLMVTFQISNTRGLGGGSHLEGFETTVHLGAGTVLLIGLALSLASVVAFIASIALDREGTCDDWPLLAGDLLMYLALAQTITGVFSPYGRLLDALSMSTVAEQEAVSALRIGVAVAGYTTWILAAYGGPFVSLVRSSHGHVAKLLHVAGYCGVLIGVSRLWAAAQRIEGGTLAGDGSPSVWFSAFAAPLAW
jgi:hypothetical protein